MASLPGANTSYFRKPIRRGHSAALLVVGLSGLLGTWALVVFLQLVPTQFFPGPSAVAAAAVAMVLDDGFLLDLAASASRIGVAFAASALLGVPIGLLMSTYKAFDGLTSPTVDFVRYVPVPALLPLFVLWTGIGEAPKFLVLFFGTFFQLVLLVKDDADNVPDVFFDVARTLGARDNELLRHVLTPYLLPLIYDRLRVTLGWCWTYLVIAELIAVERGVGHIIKEAQRFNAADRLFVALFALGLVGLLTDRLARRGFRLLFPYALTSARTN